ncbi:MAG: ABC transporter permease [Planctomycetes bacterium]|nr:ABC transporter permease [Planctomycetota bacterium]
MYRLFLAIRYLLTRPINLLGMFGIALSVWALVVVVSLFSGFLAVIESHVQTASADLTVTQLPDWAQWPTLRDGLRDDSNVAALAPRLVHHGLVARPGVRPGPPPLPGRTSLHGGDQPFVFVIGVDAAAESAVTGFGDWLRNPEIPAALRAPAGSDPFAGADDRPRVLIGRQRMERDGLHPGDPVRWTYAISKSNEQGKVETDQREVDLVVAGAFQTAHAGFDGNNMFVREDVLRKALELPEGAVQEIAVRVRDESQLVPTADRLQRIVSRALDRGNQRSYGAVETWRERNAPFLASVEHQRGLLKIVLIVIMVVAAFLMLATLSMMVTEKTGDIGILTAMGGTPAGVTQVFLACGLSITVVGVALGLSTGCLTAVYLEEIRQGLRWATGIDLFPLEVYNLIRVPCRIEPLWLLQVAGMALATGFVVSALPALRAARHDPLVSLRGT